MESDLPSACSGLHGLLSSSKYPSDDAVKEESKVPLPTTHIHSSIHWVVPTLAGGVLSTFVCLVFFAHLNYLVDVYQMYAASAIAANTIARAASGAAAPLFTRQMFTALGVGGGGSLVAGIATLLAIIPFLFRRYGKQIRVRSRFAPTPDEDREKRGQDEEQCSD